MIYDILVLSLIKQAKSVGVSKIEGLSKLNANVSIQNKAFTCQRKQFDSDMNGLKAVWLSLYFSQGKLSSPGPFIQSNV